MYSTTPEQGEHDVKVNAGKQHARMTLLPNCILEQVNKVHFGVPAMKFNVSLPGFVT